MSEVINYQEFPLYQKIEEARGKFKPEHVKLLLVAEAAPDAVDRFFYYPDVKTNDFLYLGVAKALYGDTPTFMLRSNKKEYLTRMKDDGVFLMDLSPLPAKIITPGKCVDDFLKRLENEEAVDKESTQIILIKANVYDCLYNKLSANGYKVVKERIPFPSCGQQSNFAEGMARALKNSGTK